MFEIFDIYRVRVDVRVLPRRTRYRLASAIAPHKNSLVFSKILAQTPEGNNNNGRQPAKACHKRKHCDLTLKTTRQESSKSSNTFGSKTNLNYKSIANTTFLEQSLVQNQLRSIEYHL